MTHRAAIVATALRAVLAVLFVVVGGHEAFVVGETSARIWGWVLIAVGVMLAAGAAFPRSAWGAVAGLVGSAAAAVVGGYVLYAAVSSVDPARPATVVVVGILIAAAIGSGAALGVAIAGDDDLRRSVLTARPILASVLSIGTLLTAAQFVQDSYGPGGPESSALVLSVKLEPAPSPRRDLLAYSLEVSARNVSGRRLETIGSACSVFGRRIQVLPTEFDPGFDRQIGSRSPVELPRRFRERAAREAYVDLLDSEPFLDFGFYFERDEAATRRRTVLMRRGEHDLYEAVCEVFVNTRIGLAPVLAGPEAHEETFSWGGGVAGVTGSFPTYHVTRRSADIPERSWLRRITRRDRTIIVQTQVAEESVVSDALYTPLFVFVDGAGRPDRPGSADQYSQRASDDYGLISTSTRTSVSAPEAPRRRTRAVADLLKRQLRLALDYGFESEQEPHYAVVGTTAYAVWLGTDYRGLAAARRLVALQRVRGGVWEELPDGCAGVPTWLLRAWGVLDPASVGCVDVDAPPGRESGVDARLVKGVTGAADTVDFPLDLAQHFAVKMHAVGDPEAGRAADRLTAAAYEGGALAIQNEGATLTFSYAITLRDAEAARKEAAAQVAEFGRGDLAQAGTLTIPGLADARGLRCKPYADAFFDIVVIPSGRRVLGVMVRWKDAAGEGRSAEVAHTLADRAAALG